MSVESITGAYVFSRICFLILSVVTILWPSADSHGQTTYVMQNALVDDCEGILTDSENGPEAGQYDHNETYTFTICVADATEIIIAFNFFATEETYDVFAVYDGPDVGSPLIASLTGNIQPPPVLIATSGCVTFQFTSDDNIVAAGWELEWSIEIDEPLPPALSVVSILDCPMDAITFQFDTPVDCDMMTAGQFTIIGPGGPAIAQINPLDCISGQMGLLFEVVFVSPLSQPGTYRLLFNGAIQDACEEWHDVSANVVFDLENCPFNVIIELVDDACAGDCGIVNATIIGAEAGVVYSFMWGHTGLNQPQVNVCTDLSIPLSVTVTDPLNAQSATAQYTYIPLENPIILNPVEDTVCSSRGDHFYQSSLPGGRYYSTIIPEWHQVEGRYQFWRWYQQINLNTDFVTYVAPNGCEAYDTVYVLPVNAGGIEAACLNTTAFVVNGGTPVGGIWQGPHIMANGLFTPAAAGSFVVNYTAPNGCVGYKRVNVDSGILMPIVDTVCSSQEFDLVASPYGGQWSGPGIVNSILGRIRPWDVASNQTYTYVYTLEGCADTMQIYIQQLWAGPDVDLCNEDSLLFLSQVGSWSGPGIYQPALNAFDISMLGPGEYDYTISAFGCTDVFRLYISDPYADLIEPVSFCQEDEWILINDFVDFGPWWGDFSGPAIAESNDEWYFNPAIAGGGVHTIYFDALGCQDSFHIVVEPYAEIPDYSFCELSPSQILSASPPGGTWSGPGFLDGQIGLFDPQLLAPGLYPITYVAPSGCISTDTIEIILREEVSISGVEQFYCYTDRVIPVLIAPVGGTFYINGIPSTPEFNPAILGTGTHELFYTRGSGPCGSDERIFFSVLPPIGGVASSPDSICAGENAVIGAVATGGTGTLTANWDQGLGFGFSHIVNPQSNTTYTVTVTDGCSDPFTTTAFLFVHQPFDVEVVTGPAVCYDDSSYVEIIPPLPDQYAVYWQLDTVFESLYLEGKPGIYQAEILELFSGCRQDYDFQIPGPPPLSANFTIIPNQPCIDIIDNTIQIIDLSTGYTGGWIDFGDGSGEMPYEQGAFIGHDYGTIGEFYVRLRVFNDLGCTDTLSRPLCVENRVVFYVPNVFSPNGDGDNDVFLIQAYGFGEVIWSVFSRFGEKVFEANSIEEVWDGTHRGQAMDPGVFAVQLKYTDQVTGKSGEKISNVTLVR